MSESDLEKRVLDFTLHRLPGQGWSMHMGTLYLVNDLWKEVQRLRTETVRRSNKAEIEDNASN